MKPRPPYETVYQRQAREDTERTARIVGSLGHLYGRSCFAGAIGGIADGRPSTHVVFPSRIDRAHPVPVCRYHAAAATRIGEGAWKLPKPDPNVNVIS
jgi:hypothetical protein